MTANDSSSSATSPSEPATALELDLVAREPRQAGRLPPIPAALVAGRDRDLLDPLRFLPPANQLPGEFLDEAPPRLDRSELAAALATANAAYGHPEAQALAERLANPSTRVVVTGQQPGLYGGPLLTLTKMAAAVRWAEAMTAAGQPAVAVFWVATEDHDWAEVAQTTVLGRDGVRAFDLGSDASPLLPVGMRTLGPGLEAVETEMRAALGNTSVAGLELARRWYRPGARFGEAFCRLMVHLLGARAPLMLDSMLPELKRLQRPWMLRLVERRDEVDEALGAADAEILRRGYPLQVKPQPGLSPLFLLHRQQRRRVAWTGDGYTLRGLDDGPRPLAELRQILADNPSVVSPGVLARPAIQDAVLGTTLQVMGPGELSYMAQVRAVYPVLGIAAPWTSLRPQTLVLGERQAGYLDELGVSLAELVDGPLDRLLAAKLDEDLVQPVRQQVEALIAELRQPVVALDKSLERPWQKTRDQINRNLDMLTSKVAAAISRRHQVWHRRLEQVHQTCLPGGSLQERTLSVVHYLNSYGPDFAATLCARLELDPRRLQVIRI